MSEQEEKAMAENELEKNSSHQNFTSSKGGSQTKPDEHYSQEKTCVGGDSSVNSAYPPLQKEESAVCSQYPPWSLRQDVPFNGYSNAHFPSSYHPNLPPYAALYAPYTNCIPSTPGSSHYPLYMHPTTGSCSMTLRGPHWTPKSGTFATHPTLDKTMDRPEEKKENKLHNITLAFNADVNPQTNEPLPVMMHPSTPICPKHSPSHTHLAHNHSHLPQHYHHHHHHHLQAKDFQQSNRLPHKDHKNGHHPSSPLPYSLKHYESHDVNGCHCHHHLAKPHSCNSLSSSMHCGCSRHSRVGQHDDLHHTNHPCKAPCEQDETSGKSSAAILTSSKSLSTDDTEENPPPFTKDVDVTEFMPQLSNFHSTTIDEIIALTAKDVGLSPSEHAGLKMDLFRNYIRTYEALKDAIKSQQLHDIIHPFLAEVIVKKTEDFESQIHLDEIYDAPDSIPNVPHFRHGALFANRVVLLPTYQSKIVCTYALDISFKTQLEYLFKKIGQTVHTPIHMLRVVYNQCILDGPLDQTLESLKISPGNCLDVYCFKDMDETKWADTTFWALPSASLSTDLAKVLCEAQKEAMNQSAFTTHSKNVDPISESKTKEKQSPQSFLQSPQNNCLSNVRRVLEQSEEPGFIPSMVAIEKLANTYGMRKNKTLTARDRQKRGSSNYHRPLKIQNN